MVIYSVITPSVQPLSNPAQAEIRKYIRAPIDILSFFARPIVRRDHVFPTILFVSRKLFGFCGRKIGFLGGFVGGATRVRGEVAA